MTYAASDRFIASLQYRDRKTCLTLSAKETKYADVSNSLCFEQMGTKKKIMKQTNKICFNNALESYSLPTTFFKFNFSA
jgi:hypothetical protein